jgi:hypothetical protein
VNQPNAPEAALRRLAIVLGGFSFAVILASHHIADGDLWSKLAIGAHVWHFGTVPDHDTFAFTPVLPHYIDHGYVLIWQTEGHSALLCLSQYAEKLKAVAAGLPPTTINPLDAKIPAAWWPR